MAGKYMLYYMEEDGQWNSIQCTDQADLDHYKVACTIVYGAENVRTEIGPDKDKMLRVGPNCSDCLYGGYNGVKCSACAGYLTDTCKYTPDRRTNNDQDL